MPCRLIINADDFGLSPTVNEAICALYDEGIVTSTSLMTAGLASGEAVRSARARPGLAVGLHLTLVAGRSMMPAQEIQHLVDPWGQFAADPVRAAFRYTLLPACRRELREEIAAQFASFAVTHLPWSHVDSHLHFHLSPVVFREMLDFALKYEVPGFRIPEDDRALHAKLDPEDALKKSALAGIFRSLSARQRKAVEAAGRITTRFCLGTFRTGRLDSDYLSRLIPELPDGDFELHCHPDMGTDAGQAEYQALRSGDFRRALEHRGVRLSTYPDLRGANLPGRPLEQVSTTRTV